MGGEEGKVRALRRQRDARRERLVTLLCDPETALLPAKVLAEKLGLKPESVRVYLKDGWVKEEVARRKAVRDDPRLQGLEGVDMAMMKAAQEGNVAAAKLVYARLAVFETGEKEDVASLLKELEEVKVKLMGKKAASS